MADLFDIVIKFFTKLYDWVMKFVKRQEIVEDFQKQFHDKKVLLEKNTLPSWINVKNTVANPLSALFVLPPIDNAGKVKDKKDLFNLLTKNCLVLGDAGIGKSTLLRYIFVNNSDSNTLVAYYTAEDWDSQKEDAKTYLQLTKTKTVLIIDGLDEAFHMNPGGCEALLRELSELSRKHKNVKIWIGCRKAFFEKLRSNCVAFEYEKVQLKAWKEKQAKSFIKNYQQITGERRLKHKIENLLRFPSLIDSFQNNPFRLELLAFLASRKNAAAEKIENSYDLYYQFLLGWIKNEQKRKTSPMDQSLVLGHLLNAAKCIYSDGKCVIDKAVMEDSAISGLLRMPEERLDGSFCVREFYHRSIIEFLVAYELVEAFTEKKPDFYKLKSILSQNLKDDITNFVNAKLQSLSRNEKELIKERLKWLYSETLETEVSIQEKIIYHITRLGVDASDFLREIVNTNPQNHILRLTLAYGCALCQDGDLRRYALNYAESLANNSQDAITNRAWTVVYFGDVDADPYTYKDNKDDNWVQKGPGWERARAARLKRFSARGNREKDYRFRLFDIPLFRTFLETRSWADISENEYTIISNVEFPPEYFNSEEREFLSREKEKLLRGYRAALDEWENNQLQKSPKDKAK